MKSDNESEFKDELEKFSKSKGIVELKPLPDNDQVRVELPRSNEKEFKKLRDEVEALKAKCEFNDLFRLAVLKSQTQVPYYEYDNITWNATNENYK